MNNHSHPIENVKKSPPAPDRLCDAQIWLRAWRETQGRPIDAVPGKENRDD